MSDFAEIIGDDGAVTPDPEWDNENPSANADYGPGNANMGTGNGSGMGGTTGPDDDNRPIGIPPGTVLLDAVRGRCRVPDCGPAKDGRSYYCENHLPPSFRLGTGEPRAPRTGAAATDAALAKRAQSAKVNKYAKAILQYGNPAVVTSTQALCQIPEEWMDGVVIQFQVQKMDGSVETVNKWDPSIRSMLEITETEAKFLANAAVQIEKSPQGKALVTFASALAPWFYVGAALVVVGIHAYKVSMIRNDVAQVKAVILRQQGIGEPEQSQNGTGVYDPDSDAALADAVVG